MGVRYDISGLKFGRLSVVALIPERCRGQLQWLCKCDCGGETAVASYLLRKGIVKSCGCLRLEPAHLIEHGESNKSREYVAWLSMKDRCLNPREEAYPQYGGRGIRICQDWRDDYTAFLRDMGRKPTPMHSLDRIDNDGDYEPGNCRWATKKEQSMNRRNKRLFNYRGRMLRISDLAAINGLREGTVKRRLYKGWSPEAAADTTVEHAIADGRRRGADKRKRK